MASSSPSNRFGIQSKLLLALLTVSLASLLITGYVGYITARHALSDSIFKGLTAIRSKQAEEIQSYFRDTKNHLLTLSESPDTIQALRSFKAAFPKLNSLSLTSAQQQKLQAFYEGQLPNLQQAFGDKSLKAETYVPQVAAEQYLQYQYMIANPNPVGAKSKLDKAADNTEYSQIHARYHPKFRSVIDKFGYDDIFLIDTNSGTVLYTVVKEPDLGTNLKVGPYAKTGLAQAVETVIKSRTPGFVAEVDFEKYAPSGGKPAGFFAAPVFDGADFLGVLAFQSPISQINAIMNFRNQWEKVGLGTTGEAYLIGQDNLVRTVPRKFIENPEEYYAAITKGGDASEEQIAQIKTTGTPILLRKVTTDAAQQAIKGETGTVVYKDAFGSDVLGSFQPVKLGSFNWGLVAKTDKVEAFAPIAQLTQRFLLSGAILLPLVFWLSNRLAKAFVHPIKRLIDGAKRVAAGETDVKVNLRSQDEFRDLTNSFNTMTHKLHEKEQLLQAKIQDNDRLLLNVMPAHVVERVKAGDRVAARSFADISVLYATVEGFGRLEQQRSSEEAVKLLHTLVESFDDAADKYGVEKLKTLGSTYLAVCGLSEPHPNHAQRIVDCALEMLELIKGFNQIHETDLDMEVGIHTGSVVGSMVGKSKFVYELWGEAMMTARALHAAPGINVIQVSEAVYKSLQGLYEFERLEDVPLKGKGEIPVWSVKPLNS
jgi:class 3 adenylate cyclase/Skp family chaperone for outer membrane proteins